MSDLFHSLDVALSALQKACSKPINFDELRKVQIAISTSYHAGALQVTESKYQEIMRGIDLELANAAVANEVERQARITARGLPAQIEHLEETACELSNEVERRQGALNVVQLAYTDSLAKLQTLRAQLVQEQEAEKQVAKAARAAKRAELQRKMDALDAEEDAEDQ